MNICCDGVKKTRSYYSDRVLRYEPAFGEAYLKSIQKSYYEFIKQNNIRFVFGEMTWAHEVLMSCITHKCSELSCQYLKPHTIRIPTGRFAFFKDEFESE